MSISNFEKTPLCRVFEMFKVEAVQSTMEKGE